MHLESNLQQIVRDWLKENKVTQKDLAKQAGLKESQLSRLLNSNTVQLDLRTASALWEVIRFNPAELVVVKDE